MDFNKQIVDFENRLHVIKNTYSRETIKLANESILLCRKLLREFKKIVVEQSFKSITDEIRFFKKIKQVPFAHLIYYSKMYAFESEFSKLGNKERQSSVDRFRNKSYQFLMKHIDFVNYIEQGQTHLDIPYFTRGQCVQVMMIHTDDYFHDTDFNTSHDLLLAKVTATRRLLDYLENRLKDDFIPKYHSKLKWTSSKVALTELIYALYHGRTINNGNLEIKEIANALQFLFNFDLGDYYKIYSEIRSRRNSRTKFLNELSYSLINEIEKSES